MLIYLSIFQTILIIWLLLRTPSHTPVQNTFIELYERLDKIDNQLSTIIKKLTSGYVQEL
jgi:hypothetical protein